MKKFILEELSNGKFVPNKELAFDKKEIALEFLRVYRNTFKDKVRLKENKQ